MPIRAVIFDLFDVLFCRGDATKCRAYETQLGLPERGLEHALLRSPLFREAIYGRISEATLWRGVAGDLGVDPEQWSTVMEAFYSAIALNTELLTFIRTLRLTYKTAILSNATPFVATLTIQQFHLDREVDAIIISSQVGATKPHPKIFQIAASRLNVQTHEALFVDDEQRFVAGAQAVGMYGVQFINSGQVIQEIQALIGKES